MLLYEEPPEHCCMQCDKPLFGRVDKRFCNDTCRNTFNRRKGQNARTEEAPHVGQILKTLRNNRDIIQRVTVHEDFPLTLSRHRLLELGFNYKFYTSIRKQKDGAIYYFCFEYGWKEVANDRLVVILNFEQADI